MKIAVLVVPYDSGRCDERMGRGPARLLAAIAPVLARAGHDVRTFEIAVSGAFPAEIAAAFDLSATVAAHVRDLRRDGWFPLVLSGNCNTAVGAVSGCGCRRTDVVWFDAHGEATTPETTTSGFLDGMGISILTGACWRTIAASIPDFEPLPGARVTLIGSRDLEAAESALLDRLGVHRLAAVTGSAPALAPESDGAYLHFDLDVLDPTEALTNRWSPPGGLTVDALVDSVAAIRRRMAVKGAGIGSYDPAVDHDGRGVRAAVRVVEALLAV
jgi:arginase